MFETLLRTRSSLKQTSDVSFLANFSCCADISSIFRRLFKYRALRVSPAVTRLTVYRGFAVWLTWGVFAASRARLIDDSGCEILHFWKLLNIQLCPSDFFSIEFIFFLGLTEGQPQDIDIYQRKIGYSVQLRA